MRGEASKIRRTHEKITRGIGRGKGGESSDAGWGVLIISQLFIPVSLHGGEQEGEREAERGGREATATAASMHRCSLLNVSISPPLLPSPPPLCI